MVERLSDQASRAVELARAEARSLGHGHVGTEHLLLGILAEGDNLAAAALLASGATLFGCREKAAEVVGEMSPARSSEEPPYSERASRALDRASRLALRRRHPEVETVHVLASVLDVEGRAGQVLRGLGVDPARVHRALDASAGPEPTVPETPPAATTGRVAPEPKPEAEQDASQIRPLCGNCGTRLERSLGQRVVTTVDHTGPVGAWLVAYCTACGAAIGAVEGGRD